MFPLRDHNPSRHLPVATGALVALNVASWVFVQGLGSGDALARSVCTLGLIPGALLGSLAPGTSVALGPELACVIGAGPADPWLTPVTSMFMHGGWFHILGNLWFLWIFGDNVEDMLGRGRFVGFYLISGLAAAGAQVMADPASSVPMVGASGAIGGVMGAYAVLHPRARVDTLLILGFFIRVIPVPAIFMLGYWFVLQVLGGLPTLAGTEGGVAFWAHVGGFAAGALMALPFLGRTPPRRTVFR